MEVRVSIDATTTGEMELTSSVSTTTTRVLALRASPIRTVQVLVRTLPVSDPGPFTLIEGVEPRSVRVVNTTDLSGAIEIDGSSTVLPITVRVFEHFLERSHTPVSLSIDNSGTDSGFERFTLGETDVSGASRPINDSERQAAAANGVEFVELRLGTDALAVIVHSETDFVTCLTVEELKAIWEPGSTVSNWNQVRSSFPDRPIVLVGPETSSATFEFFTEKINGAVGDSRSDYTAVADVVLLVTMILTQTADLSYIGYPLYQELAYAYPDDLQAIAIDNGNGCVAPGTSAIEDGSYAPLSRPLLLYVNKASLYRPEVRAFVELYMEIGAQVTAEFGYVTADAATYANNLQLISGQSADSTVEFQGGSRAVVQLVSTTEGVTGGDVSVYYSEAAPDVATDTPLTSYDLGISSVSQFIQVDSSYKLWFISPSDGTPETGESFTVRVLAVEPLDGATKPLDEASFAVVGRSGEITFNLSDHAPGAPAALGATAGNRRVTLNWQAAEGVAINNWQYRLSNDSGDSWLPDWTDILNSVPTTSSYVITGLTNGTLYTFEVRAVNDGGNGDVSSVLARPTAPAPAIGGGGGGGSAPAPTPVSKPPERPDPPSVTGGDKKITVDWTAPANDGPGIGEYLVQYRAEGTSTWITHPHQGTGTETTITELEPGTTYEVQVAARNTDGTGPWSASGSGGTNPLVPPERPDPPNVAGGDKEITVSWSTPTNDGPEISEYLVQYHAEGTTTWSAHPFQGTGTETTITGLEPGTRLRSAGGRQERRRYGSLVRVREW